MQRRRPALRECAWVTVTIAGLLGLGATSRAAGRDGGTRTATPAAEKGAALPPGHPPAGAAEPEDEAELPAGHPRTGSHAAPTREQLPEDTSDVDDDLPTGTIVVELRDPSDRPVPRADVTLGILQQSVAKGESRRHVAKAADDLGTVRFDGLEFGGGVAYRVTVPWSVAGGGEAATYAASPFQLDLHHGQRVRIHLYPATNRVNETMLGMDGIVYMELRDDAIQFDELFRIYNVGAVTWVPSDVVVTLPQGFKAFLAQKEMSDAGWEEVPGRGARLRGTFGPGSHETHFRYQVPYGGDESVDFSTTLPPHVARMRVMAESSKGMTLHVNDFPSSVSDRNQVGQRILLTEKQLRAGEQPPSELRVTLDNIPVEGSAKWIATAIAALTVVGGLFVAFEQEKTRAKRHLPDHDAERARSRLVAEIAELDKARAEGDVGPKAYDRIRAALIDALARLMASGEPNI